MERGRLLHPLQLNGVASTLAVRRQGLRFKSNQSLRINILKCVWTRTLNPDGAWGRRVLRIHRSWTGDERMPWIKTLSPDGGRARFVRRLHRS